MLRHDYEVGRIQVYATIVVAAFIGFLFNPIKELAPIRFEASAILGVILLLTTWNFLDRSKIIRQQLGEGEGYERELDEASKSVQFVKKVIKVSSAVLVGFTIVVWAVAFVLFVLAVLQRILG